MFEKEKKERKNGDKAMKGGKKRHEKGKIKIKMGPMLALANLRRSLIALTTGIVPRG